MSCRMAPKQVLFSACDCVKCCVFLYVGIADILVCCVWICSENQCVRCNGFPGNSTNYAGATNCRCSMGYFASTAGNVAMLKHLWFKSNVADHPLSPDYREIFESFGVKYDVLSADSVMCVLCPPNFVCMGNYNPPTPIATMLRDENVTSLSYGVLPVGAGSKLWWVPCPLIENSQLQVFQRHSIGLSSCFRTAEIWSPPVTHLKKLYAFSFPALLLVNVTNTSIITSIVNIDQDVFTNNMFAKYSTVPVMTLLPDTIASDQVWIVQLEMDVLNVVTHHAEKLAEKHQELLYALHTVDQNTGVAFSTLIPLLWACAMQQNTLVEMTTPIFVVSGVVHSVLTESIVIRTITTVMQILDIPDPKPRHIFQLTSHQLTTSVSVLHTLANPLFFVHNNLCDSYYNPQQDYALCPLKFQGTLLSTYTTNHLNEIRLSPLEHDLLDRSNTLHNMLAIDRNTLSHSTSFSCPLNTFIEHLGKTDATVAMDLQRCVVCKNSQFWQQNQCQECETNDNACENYASRMQSRPCSWTHDLECALAV